MKILAFTDLHGSITAYKKIKQKIHKKKPDYIFCLGDFTLFEHHLEEMLSKINDLGKPVYLIHGNHENGPIVQKLCKRYSKITFINLKTTKLGPYTIIAQGGGGFYDRTGKDPSFDQWVKKTMPKQKPPYILLTHAPPRGTVIDYVDYLEEHVGCSSYTNFIKTYKPLLALSGHIHENFHMKQKINKTLICNPGPDGTLFII